MPCNTENTGKEIFLCYKSICIGRCTGTKGIATILSRYMTVFITYSYYYYYYYYYYFFILNLKLQLFIKKYYHISLFYQIIIIIIIIFLVNLGIHVLKSSRNSPKQAPSIWLRFILRFAGQLVLKYMPKQMRLSPILHEAIQALPSYL